MTPSHEQAVTRCRRGAGEDGRTLAGRCPSSSRNSTVAVAAPHQGRVDAFRARKLGWRLGVEMVEDNGRVVCVVDDDASLRRSLRNLLTSVGFRVETFQSAETFLETVHRENTGCVVLDLRMTGMNGLDLLRHLGATGSRIPVIILTAQIGRAHV